MTRLFASAAPTFVTNVIGMESHAVAGVVAASTFLAAAVAQPVGAAPPVPARDGARQRDPGRRHGHACCGIASLVAVRVDRAAIAGGMGQGISFGRGLAAVSERTPPDRRAEVNSAYFLVAYVAISLPVIGEGLAAQLWGLRVAGEVFAIAVGVLAAICLVAIVVREPPRTADGGAFY